jgi:hypothetical protein
MRLTRAVRRLLLPASGLPTVFVAATGPAATPASPAITAARLSAPGHLRIAAASHPPAP